MSFGQNYTPNVSGLELKDINDFDIVVENINKNNLGISREFIDSKVKLMLRKNGISPSYNKSGPYLYINLFLREDLSVSGKSFGFSFVLTIEFKRLVVYGYEGNLFETVGPTWEKTNHLATNASRARQGVIDMLQDVIDQFSVSLIDAND